jgi:hypothetical protein
LQEIVLRAWNWEPLDNAATATPTRGSPMDEPDLLINPTVRWAVHPADTGRIAYIDGLGGPQTIPDENELITRSFLVDPQTRQPIPVRVVQVLRQWDSARNGHTLAVVVAREQ